MTGLLRLALLALSLLVACSGEADSEASLTQSHGDPLSGDGVSSGGADAGGGVLPGGADAADTSVLPGGADAADTGGSGGACWEGIKLCEGAGITTCVQGIWSEVVPCVEGGCVNGECTDCIPECGGDNLCGPDGCGGSCGVPDCEGRVCGTDGCGGSCGFCSAGMACADGACSCAIQCAGKDCGPDGCGGQCGLCQGDFACSALGECLPSAYRAVLIQDHWSTGCSNYNSTGSDIDAVALYGVGGELISYFMEVIEEVGKDECTNSYTDPQEVVGPPDGTAEGCIALQGGWIMGRFADYVPITSGMTLVVHEFGQQQGGSSEPFSVYLATGFDCAESDDPGACSVLISDEGWGRTEVTVP